MHPLTTLRSRAPRLVRSAVPGLIGIPTGILIGILGLILLAELGSVPVRAATPAAAADPASGPSGTVWFRIEIDGAPAGWASDRIERAGGRVTTRSRLELHLRRGGADVAIALSSRFVETAAGEPILLHQRQTLGQLPVETTFRFLSGPRGDRVDATTVQAGRETHETVPAPAGEWLPPDAARRAFVAHRRSGETRFTVRSIEPFQGLDPVDLAWQRLGPGTVPGAVDRWRQVETSSAATGATGGRPEPGAATGAPAGAPSGAVATVELDPDGRLIWSSTRFLGLELTLTRTDRRTALASVDGGTTPELMVSTFVHPDRPIPSPRRLRRAVYELSLAPDTSDDGSTPTTLPPLPSTGTQRVTGNGDRVKVEIEVPAADARPVRPDADEAAHTTPDPAPYLAPSPFLDSRDPAVVALLSSLDGSARPRPEDADPVPAGATDRSAEAPGEESGTPRESPRRRAARLTALVRSRITDKNLDTGFATASEVARTLSGDCTEHAVLLAALLRADGIPSRVASGLVYLERFAGEQDVFGYHMWTQALIGGRWIDLDAALPGDFDGFDATHVALAVSALDGPEAAADFVPLAGLIGRLRIEVKELRY